MSKKRFKFQVTLLVDELTSVTSVSGFWYCKLRVMNGPLNSGTFIEHTNRQMVKDNCVSWRHKFEFTCKLSAEPQSGVLERCWVRLSVRKEVRGGRTDSKVGLVDLNLAEFAGSNHTSRHCLLEGYNDKNRLDNSILKIVVGMQLLSGDPCYKVPTPHDKMLRLPTEVAAEADAIVDSDSSGFGSLPRPTPKHRVEVSDTMQSQFERGHTRNSSAVSQRSDYGSHHSRTPSSISQNSCSMDATSLYETSASAGSTRSPKKMFNSLNRVPPPRPLPPTMSNHELSEQSRVDNTRVDNEDIVSQLINDQDFTSCKDGNTGDNLQLYKLSDGTTALGGQHMNGIAGLSMYQPVVFGPNQNPTNSRSKKSS